MKRLILTILVIVLTSTMVQARPRHRPVVVHRPPVVRVYRAYPSSSYWYYHARKYRYETERIAIVGDLLLGVADRIAAEKEADARRELQQQQIAAEAEARAEAERQALFERASALKAKQAAQAENERLRLELERLQLELEKARLQKELQQQATATTAPPTPTN